MKKRILAFAMAACMMGSLTSAVNESSMKADAAEKTLNIVTTFGTSEVGQYGVPSAFIGRYDAIAARVSYLYSARFGITINFSKPAANYVVSSPADSCKVGGAYNTPCSHAPDSQCNNSGPYHHTNVHYIKSVLCPVPDSEVYGLEMYITTTNLCGVGTDGTHNYSVGVNFNHGEFMIIKDNDYVLVNGVTNWLGDTSNIQNVAKTIAHEIGHSYYVKDHYDVTYGDKRDYCIWGAEKKNSNVIQNVIMCSDCSAIIQQNSRRFNF